jgi:hypothetical protein
MMTRGATPGRFEGVGKGFGEQHRRHAVDRQRRCVGAEVALAGRLVRQGAVRDKHQVDRAIRRQPSGEAGNRAGILEIDRIDGNGGGATHAQVGRDAVGARPVAPDQGQRDRTLRHPQPGTMFGDRRRRANDDNFLD